MIERRDASRIQTSGPGKIIIADNQPAIDCVVRDISASGGCLEVSCLIELPETFHLAPDDGNTSAYSCHLVWRKDSLLGIIFD